MLGAEMLGDGLDRPTPVYDLRGLKCPLPVLKIRRRLRAMAEGEELIVETSDALAVIDIPHHCSEAGHRLVQVIAVADGHRFVIRKGAGGA